ncbi:ParB/RepB/Spo0J family partition protein [Hirschia baltica]|uniref:ParB-like partition protein n=1 Tax=Hirschia baltica (strain ATCC 49814 / DSM 5838 / IFAM 1418) TaxID=582402 RepID=C6XKA8_HIRBI|nr:ParB/RepB/Spo0J family partition protein [Hirschia baltica]ACT57706.1 parB-like partition protein [Hirschia baltica ATCC 49814]
MAKDINKEDAAPKAKPSRLGRGLMDLIGEQALQPDSAAKKTVPASGSGLAKLNALEIPIKSITGNPNQPRQTFKEEDLAELEASIRIKGVIQPILVRPDPNKGDGKYQIVAGERRWRAATRAGLRTVPAVIKELDELEVLEIGVIENVQRADLNPLEEAEAYQSLIKRFGRTQDMLADHVGKSRPHIANTLRLLNLPDEARDLLREGHLSAGHARAALGAPDPMLVVERVMKNGLSVRDTEKLAHKFRMLAENGMKEKSATKPAGHKDVDTEALESDLAHALGLNVEIKHKGNKGGEIKIQYTQLEQLDDVCRRLTSARTTR